MFYHKIKYSNDIKTDFVPTSKIVIGGISYFLTRQFRDKIRLIKFLLMQKLRTLIWYVVSVLLYPKNETYKNDTSVFFVMDYKSMERMIDFSGFQILKKITNPLSNRVTYVCKKVANVNAVYAEESIYRNYKKRTTNL